MALDFAPTQEQQAIIDAIVGTKSNLFVPAKAGCAKTSSVQFACRAMSPCSALYLAFNKKNADEAKEVLPDWVTTKTFNALGHAALAKVLGRKLILDPSKLFNTTREVFKQLSIRDQELFSAVTNLLSAIRKLPFVPNVIVGMKYKSLVEETQDLWDELFDTAGVPATLDPKDVREVACVVLNIMVSAMKEGKIDYDDQVWGSVCFHGIFQPYAVVFVDEAQDLSWLNREQLRKTGGRLIVIGDPLQAIYQFRGADAKSMENIRGLKKPDSWIDLPLNVTFRVPKVLVARQLSHAPGFTAFHLNPQGEFLDNLQLPWGPGYVRSLLSHSPSVAILSRNNAPLLTLAFRLIAAGIAPNYLGRDIGKNLKALVRTICGDRVLPAQEFEHLVELWREKEIYNAQQKGQDSKLDQINDRADCILAVLASGCLDSEAVQARMDSLFSSKSGMIDLSTGHKSKGLEWTHVFHLDPGSLPSKWAMKAAAEGNPTQMEQDLNLKYVIETRAKRTLEYRKSSKDLWDLKA